jgi:hypothetical protein
MHHHHFFVTFDSFFEIVIHFINLRFKIPDSKFTFY